jgi:hypothetical protein
MPDAWQSRASAGSQSESLDEARARAMELRGAKAGGVLYAGHTGRGGNDPP